MVLSITNSPNMQHLTTLLNEAASDKVKIDRDENNKIGFSTLTGSIKYHMLSKKEGLLAPSERRTHNQETYNMVKSEIKEAVTTNLLSSLIKLRNALSEIGDSGKAIVERKEFKLPYMRAKVEDLVAKLCEDFKWDTAGAGRLSVGKLRDAIGLADKTMNKMYDEINNKVEKELISTEDKVISNEIEPMQQFAQGGGETVSDDLSLSAEAGSTEQVESAKNEELRDHIGIALSNKIENTQQFAQWDAEMISDSLPLGDNVAKALARSGAVDAFISLKQITAPSGEYKPEFSTFSHESISKKGFSNLYELDNSEIMVPAERSGSRISSFKVGNVVDIKNNKELSDNPLQKNHATTKEKFYIKSDRAVENLNVQNTVVDAIGRAGGALFQKQVGVAINALRAVPAFADADCLKEENIKSLLLPSQADQGYIYEAAVLMKGFAGTVIGFCGAEQEGKFPKADTFMAGEQKLDKVPMLTAGDVKNMIQSVDKGVTRYVNYFLNKHIVPNLPEVN